MNAPEMWIRCDNAFEAVVDLTLFKQAEAAAAARVRRYTDEHLECLRDFLRRNGKITEKAIRADLDMPCHQIYNSRFGGLGEAYKRIGYKPARSMAYVESFRSLVPQRRQFVVQVVERFKKTGVSVVWDSHRKLVLLSGRLTVRPVVSRCKHLGTSHGWMLRLDSPAKPDVTVIARLAPATRLSWIISACLDARFRGRSNSPFEPGATSRFDRYRFETLRS